MTTDDSSGFFFFLFFLSYWYNLYFLGLPFSFVHRDPALRPAAGKGAPFPSLRPCPCLSCLFPWVHGRKRGGFSCGEGWILTLDTQREELGRGVILLGVRNEGRAFFSVQRGCCNGKQNTGNRWEGKEWITGHWKRRVNIVRVLGFHWHDDTVSLFSIFLSWLLLVMCSRIPHAGDAPCAMRGELGLGRNNAK